MTVLLTFKRHGITSSSNKKSLKKAKILNLENQAMLLVETFFIHNSRSGIYPDKHFLQNATQEWYLKKKFSEKSNKTFQEI